jgi:glucose/arabinose dehydrogenase
MALVVAWVLSSPAAAGTPATGFTDTAFATGFSEPTAIAFLPDGRLVVTEKGGAVQLTADGSSTVVGTIPVCTGSEMGLLGVAVDPTFAQTGDLYFYRTESDGGCGSAAGRSNEVVRATLAGATLGPPVSLLSGIRTDNGNHDGGVLRIGPDGLLWVGVGDTGVGDGGPPGASTNPYAQDLNALEGKILRLTLAGGVPAGNPFAGQVGRRGEIFAYGFRNPFRFGFDPLTGSLWAGDVGQNTVEEIDRVVAGGNYSWPYCEGSQPIGCRAPGDVPPAYEYDHNSGSASVTGGAFALGGAFLGDYFFADFVLGTIFQASLNPARDGFAAPPTAVVTDAGGPVDIVFGPDGALYYVAYFAGEVRRLASSGFGPPPTTTTVTSTTSTTTTTTLPPCADVPTFACVTARIDDLLAGIRALGDLGRLDEALGTTLGRARARIADAEQRVADGRRRPARLALRRAIRALVGFTQRVRSRSGRRLLGDAGPALVADANAVIADLRAMHRHGGGVIPRLAGAPRIRGRT